MLRFYLDEHLSTSLAQALRARGIDVQTAIEARLAGHGVPDPIQLSWAAVHKRAFVTGDWDFLTYGATVSPHYGVIIIPRHVPLGRSIQYLTHLATQHEPADLAQRIIVFPAL